MFAGYSWLPWSHLRSVTEGQEFGTAEYAERCGALKCQEHASDLDAEYAEVQQPTDKQAGGLQITEAMRASVSSTVSVRPILRLVSGYLFGATLSAGSAFAIPPPDRPAPPRSPDGAP